MTRYKTRGKTIGFPNNTMKEESRVCVLPVHLGAIDNRGNLFFQRHFANHLGFADSEYRRAGANVVPMSELRKRDVLCIPKPSKRDVRLFQDGMTIWGWPYIEDNLWFAQAVVRFKLTVIDFHYMYDGQHQVLAENSRIAGRLGMLQAITTGMPPERLGKVAILGKGYVAGGVMQTLNDFGISYSVFDSKTLPNFLSSVGQWDTIVNCIKWYEPGFFLNATHLSMMMKPKAFLIDISAEGIEGSTPGSIYKPIRWDGRIWRYENNHIPTIWAPFASENIGDALVPYIDCVVEGRRNPVIDGATVVIRGKATDWRAERAIFEARKKD